MDELSQNTENNVIKIPVEFKEPEKKFVEKTPVTDSMESISDSLNKISTYKSKLDWEPFKRLEIKTNKKPIRGGIVFKSPWKLVNSHTTCQQCLYAFEIDTYGRGCVHNCIYCYAKAELTAHGYWNNPFPVPVDINSIRKVFYTVFETDNKSKWRSIMEKRIPLRIGSMSDSFMMMDKKFGVTKELLRILEHYKYPYVIFTRSDLIAQDEYLKIIDKDLASIQFSISSVNDKLNKIIEPGVPSADRRFKALKKINEAGFWTTVRINPIFPEFPDGYYSDPNFSWKGKVPHFKYSSPDIVDRVAETGTPSVLVGFGRFRASAMNLIEKETNFNFKSLFTKPLPFGRGNKEYHFSDEEIAAYYKRYNKRCLDNALEYTTCYIGNGEEFFWKDQVDWTNKKDCCNIKGRVKGFKTDARSIPFEERLKHTANKNLEPVNKSSLHKTLGLHSVEKSTSSDILKESL